MLLKRASNCAESLCVHFLGLPNKIPKLGGRNHQVFVVSVWSWTSEIGCQQSHLPLKFLGRHSVFASPPAACCYLVIQSCLTLCDPMDCHPPDSSVHGISQARVLEWVAIILLQGIFPTQGSNPCLLHCRRILHRWATRKAHLLVSHVPNIWGPLLWKRVAIHSSWVTVSSHCLHIVFPLVHVCFSVQIFSFEKFTGRVALGLTPLIPF